MSAFFLSFALIFLAELGDKSQLVALWFATRYHWLLVIASVTAATLVVHLASTAVGAGAAEILPEWLTLLAFGLSMYFFAAWGLRGDSIDEMRSPTARSLPAAFAVVTGAFFLSELGDKTQLATVSLAGGNEGFYGVWLGSTAGMVAADALAIGLGVFAGRRLPQRRIAVLAAALFAVMGTLAIIRAFSLLV